MTMEKVEVAPETMAVVPPGSTASYRVELVSFVKGSGCKIYHSPFSEEEKNRLRLLRSACKLKAVPQGLESSVHQKAKHTVVTRRIPPVQSQNDGFFSHFPVLQLESYQSCRSDCGDIHSEVLPVQHLGFLKMDVCHRVLAVELFKKEYYETCDW